MSVLEFVKELRRMTNPERLKIIEAATALVREDIAAETAVHRTRASERMRLAAEQAIDLYEPEGEHTEWTALDGEEVLDDAVNGASAQG